MNSVTFGDGSEADPWILQSPPGSSEYHAWIEGEILHIAVGKTKLGYQRRAIEDCHAMLKAHGDWMELGNADEGKPVKDGTIKAWARRTDNPVSGYYGVRKGYRGRFANYVTPVLEILGLIELEHKSRGNRARAL